MTREKIREQLKTDVGAVKVVRAKMRAAHGMEKWHLRREKDAQRPARRTLTLALAYLNGTPYERAEQHPKEPPSAYWIAEALDGVDQDAVAAWLTSSTVPARVPEPRGPGRLYVVVRADLPPGAQAVKAAHAMREFAADHPEVEAEWHRTSNTVAMLSVADEEALTDLLNSLSDALYFTPFREPDLGGSLTAICVEPKGGRKLRHLPLALHGKAA